MTKIPRTHADLLDRFNQQLRFIEKSAHEYDKGDLDEAIRMAIHIRTLLHHTTNSSSVLFQLGLEKSTKFIDSKLPDLPSGILTVSHGLISVNMKDDHYVPNLGMELMPTVDFDTFWQKEIVIIDKEKNSFTRKDIILLVADTDGGAHVDPKLDTKYVELSRNNSLGWIKIDETGKVKQINEAVLATIRQIGHEILRTFISSYTAEQSGDNIYVSGVTIETEPAKTLKIGRNDLCHCGSGRKWKKCGYIKSHEHIFFLGKRTSV